MMKSSTIALNKFCKWFWTGSYKDQHISMLKHYHSSVSTFRDPYSYMLDFIKEYNKYFAGGDGLKIFDIDCVELTSLFLRK